MKNKKQKSEGKKHLFFQRIVLEYENEDQKAPPKGKSKLKSSKGKMKTKKLQRENED